MDGGARDRGIVRADRDPHQGPGQRHAVRDRHRRRGLGILGRVRRRSVRHRHEPRCAEQAGGGGRSGEPGGRSVARGDPGTGRRRRGGGASAWREAGRVASAGCPAARRDPRDGRHACPGSRIRHGRIGRRRGRPLDERRSVLHLPDLPRPADHLSLRHGHRRAVRVGRAGNAGRPGRLRSDAAVVPVERRDARADVYRRPARRCARRREPDAPDRLRRLQQRDDAAVLRPRDDVARIGRHLRSRQHPRRQRVRRGVARGGNARQQAERLR